MSLAAAVAAAKAASQVLLEGVGKDDISRKGEIDLVTQVDLASERTIRRVLSKETPDIPIYAEEGGGAGSASTRWIVDPLDGTTNYVHGFPMYGVSIALQLEGEIALGVIADPVRRRLFHAEKGKGAWCNGERLRVSRCETLSEALAGTGFPYDRHEHADRYLKYVSVVMKKVQGVRRAGAACMDLAMLASGQLDVFWEFHLAPWDVAAGILLVDEAGGCVTGHQGQPLDLNHPSPLGSNERLHDAMRELLSSVT